MTAPTLLASARSALQVALREDQRVRVLGQDVTAGGPFGLTKTLVNEFGTARICNTPISEGAIMGTAIGLALGGERPFVDLMFCDFLTAASDQLFNHAAKINFMSGGRYSVPLTVWTIGGAGTRWGAQHSQRLDGWLTQVPGLKVLAPASAAAAANAMAAAFDDPDPVVIIADRALLYRKDELPGDDESPWNTRTVRAGQDMTVAATGRLVHLALEAGQESATDIEVLDLQRLAPLDISRVVESVERTSRLLILHDEAATGGFAASLSAAVYENAFAALDAPIQRLTSPPTPVPAAPNLEDAYVVDVNDIAKAIEELAAL